MDQIQILKSEIFGEGMLSISERYSKISLGHVPVMITDKNKILCLPERQEMSHIGFSGMSSRGKGIGGNTILGFEYWMKKRLCLIFNDFQQETLEFSLPCLNPVFNKNLSLINTAPMPLPIVYVYPNHKDLIIGETEKLFPHIKMSMPTQWVINHIEEFYKLDKSAKYVTGYIERFLECKDLDEIENTINEILNEKFPDQKGKKFEEMKFKILTVFKNIFDEEITDSVSPDAPAFLTVKSRSIKNYHNYTIQALLSTGLIPSIQTSEIRGKRWFSAYMAFVAESIYQDKLKDPFLKDKMLRIYVPEIDKMWKGESGKLIKEKLSLWGTNGRRFGIGILWDAQDYDAVDDSIKANTRDLFVLRKSNEEEVRGIKKDFNVSDAVKKQILSIETDARNGIFECVAFTLDKFVLYNPINGKVDYTSEPQKGRLLTPLSSHKVPGTMIRSLLR